MKSRLLGIAAVLSLAACLVFPVWFFLGKMEEGAYKALFLVFSIVWFVLAVAWDAAKNRRQQVKQAKKDGPEA